MTSRKTQPEFLLEKLNFLFIKRFEVNKSGILIILAYKFKTIFLLKKLLELSIKFK